MTPPAPANLIALSGMSGMSGQKGIDVAPPPDTTALIFDEARNSMYIALL
jgi:hypothetical protein